MAHAFQRAVGVRVVPSKWCQMVVAIDRYYLQSICAHKMGADADEGEPQNIAHHAQAAHTACLAKRFYSNDSRHSSTISNVCLKVFQLVSMQCARQAGLGLHPLPPHLLQRQLSLQAMPASAPLAVHKIW